MNITLSFKLFLRKRRRPLLELPVHSIAFTCNFVACQPVAFRAFMRHVPLLTSHRSPVMAAKWLLCFIPSNSNARYLLQPSHPLHISLRNFSVLVNPTTWMSEWCRSYPYLWIMEFLQRPWTTWNSELQIIASSMSFFSVWIFPSNLLRTKLYNILRAHDPCFAQGLREL